MSETKPIAIVGMGAILPDAPDVQTFWSNIRQGVYSIREVPANRWRTDLYFDPDPAAPDKTYSKIGAWVDRYDFDPIHWGIPIPPSVLAVMDEGQKWAIAAARQALLDYGYPEKRSLNPERVAVILGNALAGETHYRSSLRIRLPEVMDAMQSLDVYQELPLVIQQALVQGVIQKIHAQIPAITEDTMPGELANIIAGRVANVFNFSGTNFTTDAACASSLAALQAAVDGLSLGRYDAVLTGGIDRNMGVEAFVKFSKIGALSPDGSRPYANGANGFVMGEGAVIFLLKRLEDAEKAGDPIIAVIRGIGSSSDGKGKGITAPNPLGQQRAIERAWKSAGISPDRVGLIEGHGTSTRVGDVVEVNSLTAIFGSYDLKAGQVALGSVKSNIGHLKSAAGAVGLLKVALALKNQLLPPSINYVSPNPNIDFSKIPFYVNTQEKPWECAGIDLRRACLSSFGFGGTNFHVVMEEYVPEAAILNPHQFTGVELKNTSVNITISSDDEAINIPGYRGLFVLTADSGTTLKEGLQSALLAAQSGQVSTLGTVSVTDMGRKERIAIDYSDTNDLVRRIEKALKGFDTDTPNAWQALNAQGVYRGSDAPGKVAFLFPGQGSQYVNMLKDLGEIEPVIAETFAEADRVMTPLLGKPLTKYIYVDGDEANLKNAEAALRDTTITQPAVLTTNVALLRLMKKYGFSPDLVMGHSLGEYAALVAAGVLTFAEALEVVSARGREMAKVSMDDNGCMAAVSAPLAEVEHILTTINGYVVIANINSPLQSVIGGATASVDAAISAFTAAGYQAVKIPVSHAFHTQIVAPASAPLRKVIERMNVQSPRLPIAANVSGEMYPTSRDEILDILARQVASPVQFVKGIETLYQQGARVFVEIGPKRVLNSLAADIFNGRNDVTLLSTNHPRKGAVVSFNEAVAGLLAAGVVPRISRDELVQPIEVNTIPTESVQNAAVEDGRLPLTGSVVITGAGLGLPGKAGPVFGDDNIEKILRGETFIDPMPLETRAKMLEKRVTRLVKSEAGAQMVEIQDLDLTIKLAGQSGQFDLGDDFGVPVERVDATDISTQLAIAAGIEALRDAGIPLVMNYRQTSLGSFLPNRWMLPESMMDETGVIFGSAFPGLERMAEEADRFHSHQRLTAQKQELLDLIGQIPAGQDTFIKGIETRIAVLEEELQRLDYHFDRRFIFRTLSMGHSQFAEYIGARGPNTHVNAACATTTHAVAIAEDWIRAGRCRRVVIIAGDNVTSGNLVSWIGTGLLASGATTTEGDLRQAALPFDRRRNGMIMGMGAAALVVESEDAARERGVRGICEVLASQIANSAFHGTRLDVTHVREVMDRLVCQAERRFGLNRENFAAQTMFVSHETYTPARGGSAAAEIHALRHTFGEKANQVVIANTKGFTGHTMAVGVEDVVAVKALQYGIVPPIANYDANFEPDLELGDLNLSKGGKYPVRYALRLGAGFGSQIAMTLLRQIPGVPDRFQQDIYLRWLAVATGLDQVELEVVQRTLRVRHTGAPARTPAKTTWQFGQGPTLWAEAGQETSSNIEAVSESKAPSLAADGSVKDAQRPVGIPVGVNVNDDAVTAFVLDLVSEKTGYPTEMLDLNLDLEADLGVDTVKQAELFAAVREHYGIPRREDLRLVDYNTLQKVVGFVMESTQKEPVVEKAIGVVDETSTGYSIDVEGHVCNDEVTEFVLALVSEKTGYPSEMLDLNLDLEADLGVDTVKQAELFAAVREHYGIPRREDLRLAEYNTLSKVIGFVSDSLIAPSSKTIVAEVADAETSASYEVIPLNRYDEVKTYVLAQVSEKTGYPTEMLDLNLDMEADLGVDTVKQAELFAAIREHYGIQRREDLRLSDYTTLEKVIQFMLDALQTKEQSKPVEKVASMVEARIEEESELHPSTLVRRVPKAVLRPRLDLCQSTGVSLGEESRILIVADEGKTARILSKRLRAIKAQVLVIHPDKVGLEKYQAWAGEGPVQGIFILPALTVETDLADLTAENWSEELSKRSLFLFRLMREIQGAEFVLFATRMGGLQGMNLGGATAPMGGAVSGFAKALAWERPDCLIKTVDFAPTASEGEIAVHLMEETLNDPAVVEIGWENAQRFTIIAQEEELPVDQFVDLGENPVFLISGGSGGIIAPVVNDLAKATHGKFYLLSRTKMPETGSMELTLLRTDRNELRQTIFNRLSSGVEKGTPAQIEKEIESLERGAATLDLMAQVKNMGAQVVYLTCDITDSAAVSIAVGKVLDAEGRVDVLIHAAGMERSRKLESKPEDEFIRTISVKADGFFHLYKALESRKALPRAFVAFTSVAGRFGNAGQTDYSAANDMLCKLISALRRQQPQMKAIALDWGAWSEVGMASRGHIPALMQRAGIDMMSPSEAAPQVYRELIHGEKGGEVILAGSLGVLMQPRCTDGGIDVDLANRALTEGEPAHVMFSRLVGLDLYQGIILQADLNPDQEPFLKDHALNGVPLLPGVMGIEGFAIAARHVASVLGSDHAGFAVSHLEDIQFLAPFKFYRNEPRKITWKAQVFHEAEGLVAKVTLESTLVGRVLGEQITHHFSGRVHLVPTDAKVDPIKVKPPHWNGAYTIGAEEIYRLYFHGPAFQVLEGVQKSEDGVWGKLNKSLPPFTAIEQTMVTTPLLIELCLQTAGIWEVGQTGVLSLPRSIGCMHIYPTKPNGQPIYAQVRPCEDIEGALRFDARVVDGKGNLFLEITNYQTSPLPYTMDDHLIQPLRNILEPN